MAENELEMVLQQIHQGYYISASDKARAYARLSSNLATDADTFGKSSEAYKHLKAHAAQLRRFISKYQNTST